MYKNAIIGAGQLGSRHLQGLLKFKYKQTIYVLDPSKDSLKLSSERSKEIDNNHDINFTTSWSDLPLDLDLVIVATGANVRSEIVKKLLKNYLVKNLILEKILFQDLKSYSEIGELIKITKTPTWVNHSRRMFSHYNEIKNIIQKSEEKISLKVFGGNWGLACNSLHFIDLFSFLSLSNVINIDPDLIDNTLLKSKRKNHIEFTGTIRGRDEKGNIFQLSSMDGDQVDITICIFTKSHRWIVQEGHAQKIIYFSKEEDFNLNIKSFETEFQSTLTTRIATDLLIDRESNLTTFQEACLSHIPFLKSSLEVYTKISGINTLVCPIT
ncbi:Gfo/Idh/MocA family oxidoreductase [Flavobacteriaceae bacterium]|nr:Gfo/Idh/MocA family oxidoreductase [Flavobacteriaceae bacterium]